MDRLCPLILSANGSGVFMRYVDASFAVHPNMRSHTATVDPIFDLPNFMLSTVTLMYI